MSNHGSYVLDTGADADAGLDGETQMAAKSKVYVVHQTNPVSFRVWNTVGLWYVGGSSDAAEAKSLSAYLNRFGPLASHNKRAA